MRVTTVADMFDRVGWRQDLQRSDVQCSLDDAGVLYDPEDEIELYGGYFGSLHVSSTHQDSSSTSYGTCESDIEDSSEDHGFDEVASFQKFVKFVDQEWNKFEAHIQTASHPESCSCKNERDDQDDVLWAPGDEDDEEDTGDNEQEEGEESPNLLDIPCMSRAWHEIEDAMRDNIQDDGGYRLVTFGLSDEELGRRDLTVRSLEPHVLRTALYQTWEDKVPQFGTVEIHFVRPQPIAELQLQKAIILIAEIFVDDEHQEQKPVLTIVCDEHGKLIADPVPRYAVSPTFTRYARLMYRQSHICQPHGSRTCQFWIAGRHVADDNAVPFVTGSLFKLVIGALPNWIADATSWMPQFEVFLNHFNQHVQDDGTQASIHLHRLNGIISIPVMHSVVNNPSALWQVLSQSLELQSFVAQYTADGQVGLTIAPNQNSYHFVVADSHDQNHVLVVTRSCDEEGNIRPIGVQVLDENGLANIDSIHDHLAPLYGFDGEFEFQVHYVDNIVDHALSCEGAQVVLHTIHLPTEQIRARSRSPRRQSQHSEYSHTSGATSLLQIKHVVLRAQSLPVVSECKSSCEFVQRSEYMQKHPHQFEEPMTWHKVPVELESMPNSVVEVLSPISAIGLGHRVAIVVELISNDSLLDSVRVLSVAPRCNLNDICLQRHPNFKVCVSKRNGVLWSGRAADWCHGDVLTIYCGNGKCDWKDETLSQTQQTGQDCCELHTVFFEDTCAFERVDFVGSEHALKCGCCRGLCLFPVSLYWKNRKQQQKVWLASKCSQDDELSILLGVVKPDGSTVWEHKRASPGGLAKLVPHASNHSFSCDGVPCSSNSHYPTKNGEVIVCCVRSCRHVCGLDDERPHECDKDVTGHIATSSEAFGESLSPCPSDRWCARLDPWVQTGGNSSKVSNKKVTLSLEASLPIKQTDEGVILPGPSFPNHQVELKPLAEIFTPLPDGVKLKVSSAQAIWDKAQRSSPVVIELYIDGSAMDNGSGWAVVAVASDWSGKRSFLGCAAGQTEIDRSSENWIGLWKQDNIAAEISALVAAQVAALASTMPTIVRPDLQFSRHLVQATQTTVKIGPVVEVVHNLAVRGANRIWEVRAH